MNDYVDIEVKINSLVNSKNGVKKWRSPVMSEMLYTERSSKLGYQTKLRLLQQIMVL